MLQNVFQLKADLKKKSTFVATPEIVQNDNVRFEIEVTDNGKPLALDNVQTVSLAHSTKGETVVTSGEIEGNKVIFNLGTLETKYVGQVNATVQLYDAEGRISTIKFPYYVVADPTGKDYVPSEKEQTLIEVVMSEAQAKIDELSQVDVVDLKAKQDEFTAQLAQTDKKLDLDSWELQNKKRKARPLVTFIDDDGNRSIMTNLLPLAQKHNIRFNIHVVTERLSDGRKDDFLMLQNELGWEVSSHTHTHRSLSTLSYDEQEYEFAYSKQVLKELGFNVTTASYPGANYTDDTVEIIRKYYRGAKGTPTGINTMPLQTFELARNVIDTEDFSLEKCKALVDEAVSKNGWVIFVHHSDKLVGAIYEKIDALIQYVKSLNVEIVTMNEGLNVFGNIVDVGIYNKNDTNKDHFVIGGDGSFSKRGYIEVAMKQGVTSNTLPSYFERNKVYHTEIPFSQIEGLPLAKNGGKLITDTASNRVFQQWREYGSNEIWERFSSYDTDTWSEWLLTTPNTIVLAPNSLSLDSMGTEFPSKKLSVVRITSGDNRPMNRSGILKTDRLIDHSYYIQQTYEPSERHQVFRRYWLEGLKAWSEWEIINDNWITLLENGVTNSTPITDFPNNKISYRKISSTNNTGFPSSGTLITNRITGDDSFAYQEHHGYQNNSVHKRYWNNGSWTAWEKVSAV